MFLNQIVTKRSDQESPRISNLIFQIHLPAPPPLITDHHAFPPFQRFRARANDSSGHAVWPAMRTGENISAHAKTLGFPSLASPYA